MGVSGGRRGFQGNFRRTNRSQGRFKGVPGGFKRYQENLGSFHAISWAFRLQGVSRGSRDLKAL